MLHYVRDLFVAQAVVIIAVAAVSAVLLGESMTQGIAQPSVIPMDDEGRPKIALKDFTLPGYGVWYYGEDVPIALRQLGRVDLMPLLSITMYKACISSWLVNAAHIAILMYLVASTFPLKSRWNWMWGVGIVALVADLVEDLAMVVVLINFPVAHYPSLNTVASWCSLIKWLGWSTMVVFDVLCLMSTSSIKAKAT